jgi:hypothetical protein
MRIATRVARRYLARAVSRVEYLDDAMLAAQNTLANLRSYERSMTAAHSLLRPIVECLGSKALAKIWVELDETVTHLPKLAREIESIIVDIAHVDDDLVAEEHRHTALARGSSEEQYIVDPADIEVPENQLDGIDGRITRYNDLADRVLDKDFSIEKLGDAGSKPLREYQRLWDKCIRWDKLLFPEVFLIADDLADAVADRVVDAVNS